jgi:predicted secreted protein
MQLVYNPKKGGGYRAPTAGIGVEAIAVDGLLTREAQSGNDR